MKRALSLWLPVASWMGLIFFLSSKSSLGRVGDVPDWITHGGAYMTLCWLLCRAIAGGLRELSVLGTALAVAIATLYGISDEYHQSFVPGRDSSWGDVAKDFGGATLAAFAFLRATRRRLRQGRMA